MNEEEIHPTTPDNKLNYLGAHLLNKYYHDRTIRGTDEKKMKHPVYVLHDPKDIPLIMYCANANNLQTYGIIVTIGGHRSPILVNNTEIHVFESLGTEERRFGISCATQIALSIAKAKEFLPEKSIHIYKEYRQIDLVSCGSDSFMVLKEAFRLCDDNQRITMYPGVTQEYTNINISDFMKKEKQDSFYQDVVATVVQHEELPANIAKYIQDQNKIVSMSEERTNQTIKPGMTLNQYYLNKIGNLDQLPKIPRFLVQNTDSTINKPEYEHIGNKTVSIRRDKHAKLLKTMVKQLSNDDIKAAILSSSGLNLLDSIIIEKGPLPEKVWELYGLTNTDLSNVNNKNKKDDYVNSEITNIINPENGLPTPQEITLPQIARLIQCIHTEKTEQTQTKSPRKASY